MKKTETFLSDLGAEILVVFNDKIAAWSLTNPIELVLNTEGGAGFQLSDFERLERLADVPVRANFPFIPDDLLDFEAHSEDLVTQVSTKKVQNLRVKMGGFSDIKNATPKDVLNEKDDALFRNVVVNTVCDFESEKKELTTFRNVVVTVRDFEPEKKELTTENNEKIPKLLWDETPKQAELMGRKDSVFEKNDVQQTAFVSKIDANAYEKTIFSEIPKDSAKDKAEEIVSTIWQKPLGNLRAFGTVANTAEHAKTPINSSFSAVQNTVSEPIEKKLDEVGGRQKQQLFENKPLKNANEEQFSEGMTVLFEPMFHEKKSNKQSENTEFVPIDNEGTYTFLNSTTSPDDLLDALTARIRQDFHRFYP